MDDNELPVIDRRKEEEEIARSEVPAWRTPVERVDQSLSVARVGQAVERKSGGPAVAVLDVATYPALTIREMAKLGGHARWAKLSPERRSAIARAAAQARWKKPSARP